MANEVRQMVKDLVLATQKEELTVDDIFAIYTDFDPERNRIDVLSALRGLEVEGLGVLAVGRRGKFTRFIKGAKRIRSNINADIQSSINNIITNMQDSKELVLEKNGDSTIDGVVIYHNDNRSQVIECVKDFEQKEMGVFIIGRRGGQSRFIKGVKRAEIIKHKSEKVQPKPQPSIIINSIMDKCDLQKVPTIPKTEVPTRYNIINNVVFKCAEGGFGTIEELIKQNNIAEKFEPKTIEENLEKFGYFSTITED